MISGSGTSSQLDSPDSHIEIRRRTRRVEFSLVSVAVLAVLGFAVAGAVIGLGDVRTRFQRVDPTVVLLLLPLVVWNLTFRIARWSLMCGALGVPTPLTRTVLYYLAGLTLALTPARLGEIIRLWVIARCHGYSYARLGPLFIGDWLGDAVSYLLLAAVGLSVFLDAAAPVLAAAVVVLVAISLFLHPRLLRWIVGLVYRIVGVRPRFFAVLRGIIGKVMLLMSARTAAGLVLLGCLAGLGPSAMLYIVAHQVGIELNALQSVFIVATGVLAGGLTMLPGGVGGTEPTMFAFLVLLGAPADAALAAVILQRTTCAVDSRARGRACAGHGNAPRGIGCRRARCNRCGVPT